MKQSRFWLYLIAGSAVLVTLSLCMFACNPGTSGQPNEAAPVNVQGYPSVGSATSDGVPVTVCINKDGIVYWVAVPQGQTAPQPGQISAGENASGVSAGNGYSGNISVSANLPSELMLRLPAAGTYDVYLIAEDGMYNLQSQSGKLSVVIADIYPPKNAPGYPKLQGSPTGDSAVILVKTDKAGTAHYVVLPATATNPSAQNVADGQDASGVAVSAPLAGSAAIATNTETPLTLDGLVGGTSYKAYVVVTDAAGNAQTQAASVAFSVAGARGRLVVFGDDFATTYFNGASEPLGRDTSFLNVAVTPKTGSNVIAIQVRAANDQFGSGLLSLFTTDSDSIKTDATWKYTFNAPTGWNATDFDDSKWFTATVLGGPGETAQSKMPGTFGMPSLDTACQWITAGTHAYFRKKITLSQAAAGAEIIVAGLNEYHLYVNGTKVFSQDTNVLTAMQIFADFSAGENVVCIDAIDTTQGGFGAKVICEMAINGDTIATDSSWKCYPTEVSGWTTTGFDDSDWFSSWDIGNYVLYDEVLKVRLGTRSWLYNPYRIPKLVGGVQVYPKWHWIGLPMIRYFRKTFTVE